MAYKWNTPHDWLFDKIRRTDDVDKLRCYAYALLRRLDADEIQDLFQIEMDQDGYFDERGLLRCPDASGCSGRSICDHGGPHMAEATCWEGYADCPPCESVEEEL